MRLGLLQYAPLFRKPKENWNRVRGLLEAAQADLILLPELAFTGYIFERREEILPFSETVPEGKIFSEIREFSNHKNMALVYGFPLEEGEKLFNAGVFISPEGDYFLYRKVHLFGIEKQVFDPGDSFHVFSYRGVKFGILICYDWAFPESARVLSLKGAQVILHPSNLVLPYAHQAMRIRSLENRVFTVTANRTGRETLGSYSLSFKGESQIVNPKGEVLLKLGTEEGIFEREIDPEDALVKVLSPGNDLLRDRRPRAYGEICHER